jgi:hypothetical protein
VTSGPADATAGLDEEIGWLADLVTRRYAPLGIPIERADARTGAIVSDRFILDELGDFLQNVAALAPLLGRPGAIEWALALVARTAGRRFRRGGLFESFAYAGRRWRRAKGLGLAFPYWNLDTLTGLVALGEILQAQGRAADAARVQREADGLADALLGRAVRQGHLRYGFEPRTGLTLPLSSPQLTGYVAEELIRLGGLSGDGARMAAARDLLRAECATGWFERAGLFCADVHGPLARPGRALLRRLGKWHFFTPMLTKDNTLVALALLALLAASPADRAWAQAAVERWREAVDVHFRTGAGLYAMYARAAGGPPPVVRLTFNHSLIECDIEAYAMTGSPGFLARAQDLARRWVDLQTARGLFPEGPDGAWRGRSFLDPQVDLSVNLLKLAELTGDGGWREAALANFAAIRRDFRLPAGYAWEVDSGTGEPRQSVVEVKYLGLLLKGLLGLREAARGHPLRETPLLWMLLRDR